MRLFLFLATAFLQISSANTQEISCSSISWLNVGWIDGQAGNPSKIDSYQKACGWTSDAEQIAHYNTSYKQGLSSYCRTEIAFKEGVRQGAFRSYLCPNDPDLDFQQIYQKGIYRGTQHLYFHFLGMIFSLFVLATFAINKDRIKLTFSKMDLPLLAIAVCTIISGISLRLYFFNFPGLGTFLFEEMGAGLVYIDKMHRGTQSLTGATNMTYYIGSLIWKWIFGPGLAASRSLSLILNILSIFFLYAGTKRLTSNFSALWITAIYTLNIYGISLSLLSIETSWPLFFASLLIFLYSLQYDRPLKITNSFFIGFTIALGSLTYPGFTVWIVGPMSFFLISSISKRNSDFKNLISFLCGIGTVFIPSLFFHFDSQSTAPFLKGGGGTSFEIFAYFDALIINLKDILWNADTYYLQQSTSFVESWLWGFFVLGFWTLIFSEKRLWAISLAVSILSTICLSSFATNLPGMRRGILFLIPFYIFAGVGISSFYSLISARRRWGPIIRISIAFLVGVTFYLNAIRLGDRENNAPFVTFGELLVQPELDQWLTDENLALVLDGSGPVHTFVSDIFNAYDRLRAFNSGIPAKNFSIFNGDNGYFPKDLRNYNSYLLVIEPKSIADYLQNQICSEYRKTIKLNLGVFYLLKVKKCDSPFYQL